MAHHFFLLHCLYAGVLFAAGLVVGSFLNVVVFRVPLGLSLLRPPSTCPSCGSRIAARDNIPLLGWLLLQGRCRGCRTAISWRYPVVELSTGLLWGYTGWRLAGLNDGFWPDVFVGAAWLAFVAAMVVTFLVDWDHQIILDEISLGGLALSLVAAPLLPRLHHAVEGWEFALNDPLTARFAGGAEPWVRSLSASLVGAAAGLIFSLTLYFVANTLFQKQIERARQDDPEIDSALGLGDVKLLTFIGAFLGWGGVLVVYCGGSMLGAVVGTVMRIASGDPEDKKGLAGLSRRWATGNPVIPFGPFLVVAALGYFFWGGAAREFLRLLLSAGGLLV